MDDSDPARRAVDPETHVLTNSEPDRKAIAGRAVKTVGPS
jgi:hypothetical protein